MANYVTKEQFEGGIATLREDFRDLLKEVRHGFNRTEGRFTALEERADVLESKSDAIIKLLVTRQELHNLTRELRGQGIPIADHKVFE